MYGYYFFDLDGTLTDPGMGITNSVMYALDKYGIKVSDRSSLYPFIGPPLVDSFKKFYGFSEEKSIEAVEYYREYFREKGIFENELYEGIPDVLCKIKEKGAAVVLATSKPEEFAVRILNHFGLSDYFDFAAGATMNGTRNDKADVIGYALRLAGVKDKSKAVMIGDRKHDIIGAKKNGLASAGVLYGYGSREELSEAGADFILETCAEIAEL